MEQSIFISTSKTIELKDVIAATTIAMDANMQIDSAHAENTSAGATVELGNQSAGSEVGTATCTVADTEYPVVPTVVGPYAENAAWTLHITPSAGTAQVFINVSQYKQ